MFAPSICFMVVLALASCDGNTQILQDIISAASIYETFFMEHDYLLCSPAFRKRPYYIITSIKENFGHLTGVNMLIPASDFFDRALDGTLTRNDFDFVKKDKKDQREYDVKRAVKDKLKVFPSIPCILKSGTKAEESFHKNRITHCSFAIGDADCTLGFVECRTPQPKTLMKGYELNDSTACPLELVLRGKRRSKIFDEIVYGDEVAYRKCYDRIKSFADSEGVALNPVFHGF